MKTADSSPERSRHSVRAVISNVRSYNDEADMLSLKHTAKGSFPSLALEYKAYRLGPEYIMARRMKEYLYHPGRTADVDGVIPEYLNHEFEQLYTTMKRPSPMRGPSEGLMPQKRMIDAARVIFDRERARRPVSVCARSCRGALADEHYQHSFPEGSYHRSASLHSSPLRSPNRQGKTTLPSYPDSIPFLSQSYNDPVRDNFLSLLKDIKPNHQDHQGAECFRITADRALPCPTTNAAVASLVYLSRHFCHLNTS
ncbi:hypothetical protein GL50803_0011548 [Giardia duodenalis]|uniref:Uncharacterized protein n=1 Tax=Giardia intestinalis (strain ATCC 50803 / WB clone C6) TaxID=184922 RepID=D3KFZ2_GIAIC|nr:hypothetical protein GL50803_0011548 [Giardia intestinalis]KAE8302942.1 hypothetical protein GL50803_0011548 [Giardia intestinalis]